MPIRSDHGRNATLRALATWPLHSPRRFLGTLITLVVLCTTITLAASSGTNRAATPNTPSPTWTLSRNAPPGPSSTGTPQTVTLIVGDPLAAARRFADAWISPTDAQPWRDRLAPLCTDEFRAVILPALTRDRASAVTGNPMLIRGRVGVAEVTVPLDTMVLAITLHDVTGSGDWRVADAQPRR